MNRVDAALPRLGLLSTRWRLVLLAAVVVGSAIAVGLQMRRAHERQAPAAGDAASLQPLDRLPDAGGRPQLLYISTARDATQGHVGLQALEGSESRRLAALACERVHYRAGRGACLQADRGVVTTYRVVVFDRDFQLRHARPLAGAPSRVRLSADGRLAGMTVFVSGHSYASASFVTRTSILDTGSGQWLVDDLEALPVLRDGVAFRRPDFNLWGVSFTPDGSGFYATLHTERRFLLVKGDLRRRVMQVVAEDVECPSLSPDGTRIAFKRRVPQPDGRFTWRPFVMDLATGRARALTAELRSVDDQFEWLDDEHIAYQLPRGPAAAGSPIDTWMLRADGSEPPRRLLELGASPAVLR